MKQVSNAFAKHNLAQFGSFQIFEFPLDFVYFTLFADNYRIVFPRGF